MATTRKRKTSKPTPKSTSTRRGTTRVARRAARKAPQRTVALAGRDAIAVLKADHVRIKSVLKALGQAQTAARRSALIDQAEQLLKRHTSIEEQIFYPAFREAAQNARDRRLFHEATEEHHVVDVVLPEVRDARHEPEVFAARAKVLRELVEHHIEEEHEDMFPRARRLLSVTELHDLGTRMSARARADQQPTSALQAVGALIGLAP
jgi:hemerythrin-like domain-containing protein